VSLKNIVENRNQRRKREKYEHVWRRVFWNFLIGSCRFGSDVLAAAQQDSAAEPDLQLNLRKEREQGK
jgi:hypothetical protein